MLLPVLHAARLGCLQTPAWQLSPNVQTFPSLHGVKSAAREWRTSPVALQLSAVHGFPSSSESADPGVQTPAWQVSAGVQRLPSLHAVPFAFAAPPAHTAEALHVSPVL